MKVHALILLWKTGCFRPKNTMPVSRWVQNNGRQTPDTIVCRRSRGTHTSVRFLLLSFTLRHAYPLWLYILVFWLVFNHNINIPYRRITKTLNIFYCHKYGICSEGYQQIWWHQKWFGEFRFFLPFLVLFLFSTFYQCFFPTCLIVKLLHCFCNSLMLDI